MSDWEVHLDNLETLSPQLQPVLRSSRFQVAVTGAGISHASGLPLVSAEIQGIPLRSFFTEPFLRQAPMDFYNAYREILKSWRAAVPNEAHMTLARYHVWVITQNIDGLHRDAGSERLIELHGNLRELRCRWCQGIYNSDLVWRDQIPKCPTCDEVVYPGISLEGNEVRHWSRAVDWVGRAEVLWVIGTTLEMLPIRGLPTIMQRTGGHIVRVNESAERILPYLLTKSTGGTRTY